MSASFFARDQRLIWRSTEIASIYVGNPCDHTNFTGLRVDVYPLYTPF